MKFFFHSKEAIDPTNIQNKFFAEGFGFFISVLSTDSKSLNEQLQRIYDAADIIADKRYDEEDQELTNFVSKNEPKGSDTLLHKVWEYVPKIQPSNGSKSQSSEEFEGAKRSSYKSRLRTLEGLFYCAEFIAADADAKRTMNEKMRVLHLLATANVCLRISQFYHDTSDFQNANKWVNRAGEIIWHGKGLAKQAMKKPQWENDSELKLYLFALRLNQASYYLDYARKNRRSNYSSAIDELKSLIEQYSPDLIQNMDSDLRRRYALIYVDAKLMQISIWRRKYETVYAFREIQQLYDIIPVTEETRETGSSIYQPTPPRDESISFQAENSALLLSLDDYDKNRSRLLTLLYYARICRDLHSKKEYIHAIAMGQQAIILSQKMDGYSKHKNMDAVVIISSTLRKLIRQETYNKAMNLIAEVLPLEELESTPKNGNENGQNAPMQALTFVGLFQDLSEFAKANYFDAISERIKWYYLNLTLKDRNQEEISGVTWFPEKKDVYGYFKAKDTTSADNQERGTLAKRVDAPMDVRLKFLEGIVHLKDGDYKGAKDIFLNLLEHEDYRDLTKYIRTGTIGLKSRYLLSRVYLSAGDYGQARRYLEEIQDTLQLAGADREPDYRTVVDLAYCYIRQGDYERAYKQYEAIGLKNTSLYPNPKTSEEKTDQFLSKLSKQHRIAGLNNLIRCCLFSIKNRPDDLDMIISKAVNYARRHYPSWFEMESNKKPLETARQVMQAVRKAIEDQQITPDESVAAEGAIRRQIAYKTIKYLEDRYSDCSQNDSETNLLKGYYKIPQYKLKVNDSLTEHDKNTLEQYRAALECFKQACHYEEGFTQTYANKNSDLSKQRHSVEYLSSYVITVIRLYKLTKKMRNLEDECRGYEEELRSFLNGIPKKVEISMKAAIALAEWLLEYAKDSTEDSASLFRSFCYVTIYEERGAMVFNQLKDNREFRLLESRYRGEILALLLSMYKPIKALKEECAFNLDDLQRLKDSDDPGKPIDLVHYTSMDTLKVLLQKKIDVSEGGTTPKAVEPRFRINNCGYMNDVFEGSVFLRCLRQVAVSVVGEEKTRNERVRLDTTQTAQSQKQADNLKKADETKVPEYDYETMLSQFFPYLAQTATDRKPVASNVYIGSLSVKADSFPIWDSYANKEKGCNISFGEQFFDINGAQYYPHQLREYMISNYTDKNYPLYIVQYIESEKDFQNHISRYLKEAENRIAVKTLDQIDIEPCGNRKQHCGTEVIDYMNLCRLLHHIYLRWRELYLRLNEIEEELKSEGTGIHTIEGRINLARQFAADRLNEIRFLFKDADYEFEAEVRIVHTEAADSPNASIEYNKAVPSPYTDIKRDLEGLTVRLGSKISDSDVDKIVTWLKQTGRVDTVKLSTRNRYILRTMQ